MPSAEVSAATEALDVVDWRREVAATYADVRRLAADDPAAAHAEWVRRRDALLGHHPASPLSPAERAGFVGLDVAGYDPAYRFETVLEPATSERLEVPTGTDGVVPYERIGTVRLDGLGSLAVWALRSYGGGLFLPVKDALAGTAGGTYGGGRYVLDTVKGADLGSAGARLVVDLNFAYNPSCAYDDRWACPLATSANTLDAPVPVGERAWA
ncbi:DUF1684 domain-containing protein [Cellulomonas sp. DKR-3]|uniref:DUF1684 domain-containing protein n=1 Tax=Cellulomonas fulva TaxID=2835530 RepID=A0ABS5TW37_9CELL|nr:DUF1684 domain-containing protein [Cellulomonas fulva]MBT0993363.1 DUF1684 domain-containing protein [Cellulomonas fulva]